LGKPQKAAPAVFFYIRRIVLLRINVVSGTVIRSLKEQHLAERQTGSNTEMSKKISGFDLGPTATWYSDNSKEIMKKIQSHCAQGLTNKAPSSRNYSWDPLEKEITLELKSMIYGFPETALSRAVRTEIQIKPSLWFKNDSTPNNPTVTENVDEALSPSSIVPGCIVFDWPDIFEPLTARIYLYQIPTYAENVRRIIETQAIIHEVAHSVEITASTNYQGRIKLPDGREIKNGPALILEFGALVDELKCGPISQHSSTYWRNGKCSIKKDKYKYKTVAIREELVESIVAYLLGFAFCETLARRKGMGLDPFQDRPQVRDWVKDFLYAERV
jgi:hypothetical protein